MRTDDHLADQMSGLNMGLALRLLAMEYSHLLSMFTVQLCLPSFIFSKMRRSFVLLFLLDFLFNLDDFSYLQIIREKYYNKITIDIIKKFILNLILPNITSSQSINNCSFIDIMNYNTKWSIGYTGTISIPIIYNKIPELNINYFDICEHIISKKCSKFDIYLNK